ncbi:MAG: 1-deoxy-D-xylulose-5-phosphate synthase [Clostridia bacterium]|nr:1-deoxy-D-xylulose-5-phosphate synthase [Clostridia bacterium]
MEIIEKLTDKSYIKNLNSDDMDIAAERIRKFLVDNVLVTGGHLASNLGVVELTLAIHKVFDFPKDKIIFDVGHQCYVHKILSGRYDKFSTLRQLNGLSGFPKTEESEYDSFNTGHSGTSISAALGMARARDLSGEDFNVIAFIGDGSISNGMSFEALNDAGASNTKIIIILNDNEMSINENVGGLSTHLSMLRLSNKYIKAKSNIHRFLDKCGFIGKSLSKIIHNLKNIVKIANIRIPLFQYLGINYIGLIDGYNIDDLTEALEKAKNTPGPVIVHTITKKGKGYYEAEENPSYYHGVSPAGNKQKSNKSYTDIFGEYMLNKGSKNKKLVSITAAMGSNCGLDKFSKQYPERFFDIGISEEHGVTLSAGFAKGGFIPVYSVYSTFLQRGYDQILHDVCMQNLHVVFSIDRAGIVGEDGETHQGTFDFSYLLHLPNITVMAPSCINDFKAMLDMAIDEIKGPVAIRFPKDIAADFEDYKFNKTGLDTINYSGDDILILSVGRMAGICKKAYDILASSGYKVHLVNVGVIKPLNSSRLNKLLNKATVAVTVEDNIISGGAGEYIISKTDRINKSKIINMGFNDSFVPQGKQFELFEKYDLTAEKIVETIKKEMIQYEQQA